jgi:hypothetical protein
VILLLPIPTIQPFGGCKNPLQPMTSQCASVGRTAVGMLGSDAWGASKQDAGKMRTNTAPFIPGDAAADDWQ